MIGDGSVTRCNATYSHPSRHRREAIGEYLEVTNGPLQPGTTYTTFTRALLLNVSDLGSVRETLLVRNA